MWCVVFDEYALNKCTDVSFCPIIKSTLSVANALRLHRAVSTWRSVVSSIRKTNSSKQQVMSIRKVSFDLISNSAENNTQLN